MKTTKAVMLMLVGALCSDVHAAVRDCNNASIRQIIDAANGTTLVVDTANCGNTLHLCLDSTGTYMTPTRSNRVYAHVLAKHVAEQSLVRLSYDDAIRVEGCGFALIVEVR